ncbi:Di-copper centre-containing protein [Armillaria gallica]|uniref:Di-copper centre-containing protein n=1 Tax=Armillaria gallica TaxID=47427 RepID=A0A2H3CZT2_ARMGA|nr:Di-copper centre-containing protein [Armillaria gallica]
MRAVLSKLSMLILAAVQLPRALAAPGASRRRSACTDPTVRVEWNTLTEGEKAAYFAAELCLLQAPAQTDIPYAVSRYDDLVGTHQQQSDLVDNNDFWHVTGQFLHVHRYYVHAHETALRNECGYTGAIPYWNEAVDAGAFAASPVLLDFGGNGSEENDWAVIDGPFANLTRTLSATAGTSHLLAREVDETTSIRVGPTYVDALLALDTLAEFRHSLGVVAATDIGIHVDGHAGVGGDMVNVATSPNDPLFWMHHGFVDYLWWKWQGDNETRINDLNNLGYESQKEPATGYVETNGATVLYMFDIIPNATVADVLDTQDGLLCYTYAV